MKTWIKSSIWAKNLVRVYTGENINLRCITLCRKDMARLLRGTGKRLPKHGSNEVVEVELTAK